MGVRAITRVMSNPYRGKPSYQFWRAAVATPEPQDVDPIVDPRFTIARDDRIATAGSCFAQHIARKLAASGYDYMLAESAPATPGAANENYGTFSARYGNIYSVRQLLQLFRRAYATFVPVDDAWQRPDGRFVDPFRPQIQAAGFADPDELAMDRKVHIAAVRDMFETCDVLVFTLGLTEAWEAVADGAVYPLAPGTVAPSIDPASYAFRNFTVAEMEEDLARFITYLRGVNPQVRLILTVSPVPLVATFEPRHVLVSTTYSKAALRVVAEQILRRFDGVDYFPSYEMITGPHSRGAYYADDLREVLPDGVAYVMRHFGKHYLAAAGGARHDLAAPMTPDAIRTAQAVMIQQTAGVICDEEMIERSLAQPAAPAR